VQIRGLCQYRAPPRNAPVRTSGFIARWAQRAAPLPPQEGVAMSRDPASSRACATTAATQTRFRIPQPVDFPSSRIPEPESRSFHSSSDTIITRTCFGFRCGSKTGKQRPTRLHRGEGRHVRYASMSSRAKRPTSHSHCFATKHEDSHGGAP